MGGPGDMWWPGCHAGNQTGHLLLDLSYYESAASLYSLGTLFPCT